MCIRDTLAKLQWKPFEKPTHHYGEIKQIVTVGNNNNNNNMKTTEQHNTSRILFHFIL